MRIRLPRRVRYHGAVYHRVRSTDPESVLLLTDKDLDGSCCALAAQACYPDLDVEFETHETIQDRLAKELESDDPYNTIIVADMLPSDEDFVRFFAEEAPGQVHYFDHHQGQEYLNELEGSRHDEEACSGLICAQELGADDDLLRYAEVVDAWDRFQRDSPDFPLAEQLMMLHNFIGQEDFIARGPTLEWSLEEEYCLNYLSAETKRQIEAGQENKRVFRDHDGKAVAFLIGAMPAPHVAHAIYEDPNIDYVALWRPPSNVSLYSDEGGPDVSLMARARGGGGHKGAAGFIVKHDLMKRIAASILRKPKTKDTEDANEEDEDHAE